MQRNSNTPIGVYIGLLVVCLGIIAWYIFFQPVSDTVGRYIDESAGVVCWTYQRGGISCLPLKETTRGQQ